MGSDRLVFRVHAIQRMFERQVRPDDVRHLLQRGEIIADYPDDKPFPSQLVLGWISARPLHVVVAHNRLAGEKIVVTVYEPDPAEWEAGFKRRKRE